MLKGYRNADTTTRGHEHKKTTDDKEKYYDIRMWNCV